jgi:hypothetical protein
VRRARALHCAQFTALGGDARDQGRAQPPAAFGGQRTEGARHLSASRLLLRLIQRWAVQSSRSSNQVVAGVAVVATPSSSAAWAVVHVTASGITVSAFRAHPPPASA